MKYLLTAALTLRLVFTFTSIDAKKGFIRYSEAIQRFAFSGNHVFQNPPIERTTELMNLSDTTVPRKKNKNAKAQDYGNTKNNKADIIVIINIGNVAAGNDTTPIKHEAQDFNTTRSNRQNSNYQMGIIGNSGNNSGNNNDSVPQKNYAQDFNTTRSNRQNSNYQMGIIGNSGNNSGNSNDSVPKKNYAQDFNTTRSNRQNSNYQMGIIGNSGNNSGNNNDSVPQKNYAQDFNTTRSNRQNSNYQMGIIGNSGNNSGNSNDSVPKKNYAQDFNTTRSNRQNSNYQMGIIGNSGNNSGNSNDSVPQKNYAQDFNTTRSNRQNSNYQMGIIGNSGNNSGNNNDSVPQKNYAQDFNTTRSNRQNSNYNQKIVINVGGNSPSNKGQSNLRIGQGDGTEVIDEWSTKVIVVNLNDSGVTQSFRKLRTPPTESYNPWEMDDANEGTVMNSMVNSSGKSSAMVTVVNINGSEVTKNFRKLRTPPTESYNPWEMDDANEGTVMNSMVNSSGKSSAMVTVVNINGSEVTKNFRKLREPPTESYNPWEMDDANEGTVMNSMVNSSGKNGDNPLFESASANAIIINIGNSLPNNKDSLPGRQEYGDYNSTRSNKANCVVIINGHDNGQNNNDSIPSRQEAQDYNSSRSNKTYPRLKNPLYHDKGNSGSNPMYEGTNKNQISEKHYVIANNVILVIREMDPNKNANQEKDNPLYGGDNTVRENPLFEGHAFTGNNGGDSTPNPGKQPSRQEAQDYNSTRSNKCNCFSIEGGFANGNSNHTGNGWNIEMENQIPISKRLKMAFSAGYAALQFKYKGSQHLSEEYVQNMKRSIRDNKWSLMTLSAGPVWQLGKGKLTTDLYGKAGITFIQVPDQFVGIPDNEGTVTKETGAAKFAGSTTALSFQAGVQFNYAISRRIDIFLNPNFFSSAGKIITYKEKDASKALIDGKTFDYKTFMSLPYEAKQEQLSMFGVNAGLKFRFCR